MKHELLAKVLENSQGRVLRGPFRGMRIDPSAVSWADGDIIRKLLGTYEEELHSIVLDAVVTAGQGRLVNVGCAEGYYAVGFARLGLNVVAVDIQDLALDMAGRNAGLNEVSITFDKIPPPPVEGDFWWVDIEGEELNLLSDYRRWIGVTILVELHEWKDREMVEKFRARFSPTHKVALVEASGRNPNRYPFLSEFPDSARWQAMSEGRPEQMRWMYLTPKR
jgi:SAM-dependent methyltransferase